MKIGLVLEGGGMRGMYTAGVIDVLLENGIYLDGAVGVSAGITFGCNYKSKQNGRVIRYAKRFAKDKRFCSLRSLIKTGDIFGAKFCYDDIPNELDVFDYDTYKNNPMPFYAVATSTDTGKAKYVNITTLNKKGLEWMRASASMPLVSRPVEIDGKTYLDGGISDSIPLRFMEYKGYEKNVVVLTQPLGYIKKKPSIAPFLKVLLKDYPAVEAAMKRRHKIYNKEVRYVTAQEKAGKVFVIRPDEKLNVGRIEHDEDKLEEAYQEGRKVMERNLSALKEFIG